MVPNWAFDDLSFTLIVAESGKVTKLFLETTVVSHVTDNSGKMWWISQW